MMEMIGKCSSYPCQLENGVPQGSVLSVTLFLVAINDILCCTNNNVKGLLYADDLVIFCSGKQQIPRLRKILVTLSKLESWCNINGFQFSVEKTVAVTFSRKRENRDNIENLTLFNQQIPFCRQNKFLGVILDKSLTFRDHILHIKAKSNNTDLNTNLCLGF